MRPRIAFNREAFPKSGAKTRTHSQSFAKFTSLPSFPSVNPQSGDISEGFLQKLTNKTKTW